MGEVWDDMKWKASICIDGWIEPTVDADTYEEAQELFRNMEGALSPEDGFYFSVEGITEVVADISPPSTHTGRLIQGVKK